MSLRLPPLNTLRMFESAGRHLSFSEAAAELGVTRSAVGHGVNALEAWLGVPLFQRTARGLVLTEAGRRYHPAVARSLSELAAAVEATPGRPTGEELRVTVSPTFASRILLPRHMTRPCASSYGAAMSSKRSDPILARAAVQ